jgi:ABC-type polysaccharide/polyol phosphate export permease
MFASESRVAHREVAGAPGPIASLKEAIREISSRRRLIRYLVAAEMKKRGSDTLLGNLWWIIDPLLQMVVYVVFISIIARRPAPDYPLFIFAAILPWKWYQSVITDAATTVIRQEKLIKQIAFPKLVLPVATVTAGVVGFAWGLIPLVGLIALHPTRLSVMLLWLPVIAAVQYVFSLASAVLVSAANVFFRDLGNAIGHALRLWWFMSPGLYSLDALKDSVVVQNNPIIGIVAGLNPFAVLFEAYRAVIYGTPDGGLPHPPDLTALAALFVGSLIFLALCVMFFKRLEPDFAKVL